jgi:hypothetical protein
MDPKNYSEQRSETGRSKFKRCPEEVITYCTAVSTD